MNEPSIKCRVCWEVKETNICVMVNTKWAKESVKTIKDVILLCVPWMTIKDDNYLCKPCLWQLKFTYDFIERCLKTENTLNENNSEKLTLEDIFQNSLRKGNKIQIIFENPLDIQIDDVTEDTDVNLDQTIETDDVTEDTDVNLDQTIETDDATKNTDVHLGETTDVVNNDLENLNVQIRSSETDMPSEHDYCIRKGAQIVVSLVNNQPSDMPSKEQNALEKCKKISNKEEKENIITVSDTLSSNDTDDFFCESNTTEKVVDPSESNILRNILATRKKIQHSTTVLTKPDSPVDSQQSKLENELKELLDIAPLNFYFLATQINMSAEEQNDLVGDGVNILNMSKTIKKNKRTIYLSRDLWKDNNRCSKCNVTFLSRCDYMDHIHLHRRGKINTPGLPLYKCKICSETFSIDIEFRTHAKRFHGISSPHECTKCKKRFKTHKLLKEHTKRFKDQEKCVFKCTRCNAEFATNYSRIRHENDIKDAPCCNYKKCRVCLKKFTKEDFKIHCIEVHPNYLCSECGKSFNESSSLATHKKNVHNPVQTMCHECGKILSHQSVLLHHIETVHGTGEKNYICDKCPQRFVCKSYLQKHMKKHLETTNGNRRWRCDPCGKNYSKKETLKEHTRMFHLRDKKYVCPICNEGFTRKDYFERHLNDHEKYIKNTCNVCRKSFGSAWRLECHMFSGHDENGKSLKAITASRKQLRGRRVQFQCVCKICNKVLANPTNLRNHYKAHLNIREAKCDICGIIFKGSLALNKHKKLHSNPNYQFSCNICHAYKSSSIELENHMRDVHKNKKYKCSICSETFGRKHLLHSHETVVHQEEVYKKAAILEMLQEDQIFVPSEIANKRRTNKGIKLGKLEVDVDTVFSTFVNKTEDFEMAASTSQGTTAGELYRNFTGNETPMLSDGKNVTVLENECSRMEDARACSVLEEENAKSDLYISYR